MRLRASINVTVGMFPGPEGVMKDLCKAWSITDEEWNGGSHIGKAILAHKMAEALLYVAQLWPSGPNYVQIELTWW